MGFLRRMVEATTYKKLILTAACVLFILAVLLAGMHGNRLKTLASLKEADDNPLYIMKYYGGYGFDEYISMGAEDTGQFLDFLKRRSMPISFLGSDYSAFACSCFLAADGDGSSLYGRNLDLPGSDHPAMLLFTDPPNGYASVSMVELATLGYSKNHEEAGLPSSWKNRRNLMASPYFPRDGMNEWGVAVATLNVPHSELRKDPEKVTIGRWQVNRLILDYAKNVDEAVILLEKYNIDLGSSGVHYFIGDASGKSAVIEFIEGDMKVTYNSEPWQVVTNFIVSNPGREGGGQDRYESAYRAIESRDGRITSGEAMGILEEVSQPSTTWSVVYNLSMGDVHISMGRDYKDVKKLRLNIKNQS